MKASELIAQLQALVEEHGDLEVMSYQEIPAEAPERFISEVEAILDPAYGKIFLLE